MDVAVKVIPGDSNVPITVPIEGIPFSDSQNTNFDSDVLILFNNGLGQFPTKATVSHFGTTTCL